MHTQTFEYICKSMSVIENTMTVVEYSFINMTQRSIDVCSEIVSLPKQNRNSQNEKKEINV